MDFKYGDLVIKCHQCGDEEILEEMITDGRAIYLFNKNDSYLRLHCSKCDITMEMSIIPSKVADDAEILEETKNEVIENEELPEEVAAEEVI